MSKPGRRDYEAEIADLRESLEEIYDRIADILGFDTDDAQDNDEE